MNTPPPNLRHSPLSSFRKHPILLSKSASNTLPPIPSTTPPKHLLPELRPSSRIHGSALSPLENIPPNLARNRAIKQIRIVSRSIPEQMPKEPLPARARRLRHRRVPPPHVVVDFRALTDAARKSGSAGRAYRARPGLRSQRLACGGRFRRVLVRGRDRGARRFPSGGRRGRGLRARRRKIP
jgi:hypothetical protein